ncbi:endonuclease domain-containing protein [Nocardia sp. NPDC058658]|uniref:endonuclease domain-containing protein n=1 Tax=Nocardia sp. NPDC058658 TaxID=3346580 RepID=UPI00365B361F
MVTRWQLVHDFLRIAPDVYARRGVALDAVGRAQAAVHWTKGAGVLVGLSAAAVLGTKWIEADSPAEVALPISRKAPSGIRVIQARIARHERCEVDGFAVTTPVRTAFDLGRRLPRDRAVPIIDALCRATTLTPNTVSVFADEHPGARGCGQLRALLPLIDPGAESPPESLTRLLLVDHGLPAPTTQLVVRTTGGEFIARLDMGWERWRVAVEYDGAQHWTDTRQRTEDIDRHAALSDHGWQIIRVGADLLRNRPHILLDRVHTALASRGAQLDV